jgi:hypothetical protein
MKNSLLLFVFFLINGVMFNLYFVPNINKNNTIDQLQSVLLKVKKTVPIASKIYFLTQKNIQENPEIYYKAQFSLAPRVVIAEKYENIPKGSFVLQVLDKKKTSEVVMEYTVPDFLFADENEFFKTTLLKKKR